MIGCNCHIVYRFGLLPIKSHGTRRHKDSRVTEEARTYTDKSAKRKVLCQRKTNCSKIFGALTLCGVLKARSTLCNQFMSFLDWNITYWLTAANKYVNWIGWGIYKHCTHNSDFTYFVMHVHCTTSSNQSMKWRRRPATADRTSTLRLFVCLFCFNVCWCSRQKYDRAFRSNHWQSR